MMRNKDNENEGIGIFTIIILVALAILGLYFLIPHHPASLKGNDSSTVLPLEVPAPVHDNK